MFMANIDRQLLFCVMFFVEQMRSSKRIGSQVEHILASLLNDFISHTCIFAKNSTLIVFVCHLMLWRVR